MLLLERQSSGKVVYLFNPFAELCEHILLNVHIFHIIAFYLYGERVKIANFYLKIAIKSIGAL